MNDYILAGEGALWVQPGGPNTDLFYLGCHELGDIDQPKGDVKLLYKPSEEPNKYEVMGSFQAAPGPVTTSLVTLLKRLRDQIENVKCPAAMYVNHVSCGKKNVFGNWDRLFLMERLWITKRGLSKLTSKDPETQDKAEQKYELSSEDMLDLFQMSVVRQTVSETESLYDISFCNPEQCAGPCGDSKFAGQTGYIGSGVLSGSPVNVANVLETDDGGVDGWPGVPGNPFAAGEIIIAIRCFQLDRDHTRILAVRGTTDAGNPAEVAYSDDDGHTWTQVNVGSTNAQYGFGPQCLMVLDYYHIWLVTNGGYIYFSEDGGATWTAQTSGGVTVQTLYAVHFSDERNGWAVGANNTILKTTDGGTIWSAVTGPTAQAAVTILSVWVHSSKRVFLGYNDGKLYYTHDGGTTFNRRDGWTGSGTGKVISMDWYDEYVGLMIHENATTGAGELLFTVTGGTVWEALTVPTNVGLNAVKFVSPYKFYAVGDTSGGTGMVLVGEGG